MITLSLGTGIFLTVLLGMNLTGNVYKTVAGDDNIYRSAAFVVTCINVFAIYCIWG